MTAVWETPSGPPHLPGGELHVWRVGLDLDDGGLASLYTMLSPDERARSDRLRLPRDRRRFTAARGTLRVLIGQVLGQDPAGLDFTYGPQGKPSLPLPSSAPPLAFNLSHSGDTALIALHWGADVGVDIERVRDGWEWEGVARRFYGVAELAWLYSLPPTDRAAGFFRLWTRKEAYLKARGEGVWHDPSRLDVTQNEVQQIGGVQTADASPWLIEDLHPGDDCRAAVCIQSPLPPLRTWEWVPVSR